MLYASMHGGAAADIGYLESLSGDWSRWSKGRAPWECAVQGASAGTTKATYIPETRTVNRSTDGLWYEVWLDNTDVVSGDRSIDLTITWSTADAVARYTTMRVDFAASTVVGYCGTNTDPTKNPAAKWTVTDLGGQRGRWHVGMWLTFATSGAPTFAGHITYPDGRALDLAPGTPVGAAVPAGCIANIALRIGGVRAEALQVAQLPRKPASADEATQHGRWAKTAVLDAPDIPLRVIPAVSGTAWDAITAIAKATVSTAEFDARGVFRWRTHSRWATAPTKEDLTVTSRREIASLTIAEEIDACRNHIAVKWANWQRVKADVLREMQAVNAVELKPGASSAIAFTVGDGEYDTPPPATWDDVLTNVVRFTSGNTDNAPVVHGAVEVSTRRENGAVVLGMRNRSTSSVWLRGKTLTGLSVSMAAPALGSGAAPADHWSMSWNATSQRAYGVQSFDHDPNGWVQDSGSADRLATALRIAGQYPAPVLTSVEVLADPRIRLGDVVRVEDTTGADLDTLAWVVGIRTEGSPEGVRQTLTLRGTAFNGLPADEGLTPDPPVAPGTTP
ncbi:hypothetical protein H8N00_02655 [Streptomyces sp. AC563]|uniref:hypothetical protein n=3 Tax=Streptomyces buecherae TaxID=2763006 RepID=UPI00164E5303|nr:hypothetical protein [Streptomyces buecherae]MBC3987825.1 hypothetical protein [Streptomyces buecherae]